MNKIILAAGLAVIFSSNFALAQHAPAPANSVVTAPADTGYQNDHDYAGVDTVKGDAGGNGGNND